MMEISKTGEDEVEQDRNTVKYAAESESHITDLAAPADPMYSFTEQENAPEQQLDGNVEWGRVVNSAVKMIVTPMQSIYWLLACSSYMYVTVVFSIQFL